MLSDTDVDDHYYPSIRQLDIERNGNTNCGFHLTRSKWDPYPWVSVVDVDSPAYQAGIKPGDCLLEVNGEDIIGQRICEVAEIVKSKPDQVSLLLWNAGVDTQCSPEVVCCGPMPTNLQRLSACMSTILGFLECPICLDTIPPPTYQCDNGHLICMRCRTKSERCPVCRTRLNRGRSLFSDQVYNALIDAFNLRDESDEIKTSKMQRYLRIKNKDNKIIPNIKITTSHTNKFLARINGKSSSVDNLITTATKFLTPSCSTLNEFNTNLKIKSLSTNEIFQYDSPTISRSGSVNKLHRNEKNKFLRSALEKNPVSHHGSFEYLNNNKINFDGEEQFHCPFEFKCPTLIKGRNLEEHFQNIHTGPLIVFHQSNLKISLHKIIKHQELCHTIHTKGNTFYLKTECNNSKTGLNYDEILIWMWCLGNENIAKKFEIQVKIINQFTNNIIFYAKTFVLSLSTISYQEMKETKKGIFFNLGTLSIVDISKKNIIVDIEIVRSDFE